MLVGRDRERSQLDALLSRVRAGGSAALVITGEAGVGKTSLLEYAISQADGLRVLRARGAESEQNLPFAGLADLVRPVLGHLDMLPGRQRTALAAALAVGSAAPADRFAVCAATFGLIAAAAAEGPVLAIVDDAQWLDAASAQAVEFTARRLGTEGIGVLVAIRDGADSSFTPARIDSVAVTGLDRPSARELLARSSRPIAGPVADQLADGVGGNPLALLELPTTLTEAQLAGLASLPEPLPVAAALRHAFTQHLTAVGPAARRLLLVAAADAAVDLATLQRACELLALDLSDLAAAEEAGLVRVDAGRVEFTHPLLRSAAYHTASPADRRAAHQALAETADPGQDPIRQAWHLAAATIGPDETVAESLDLAAGMARARNAYAAASRAHQRAAELTADPGRQVPRWMAAGQAAHLGGDLNTAARLLTRAADLATDPCVKADAQAMLAHATIWSTPLNAHYHELVAEAKAVLPFDQQRAATLLALAAGLCIMTGQFDLALNTASRAAGLCRAEGIPWLLSQMQLADAMILTGNRLTGRQLITGILADPGLAGSDPAMYLLRMLCGQALIWCEDYQTAAELLRSSWDIGRVPGRLADLPYGLSALSELHFRTGEWRLAYADAAEAVELAADFAAPNDVCYALVCAGRIEASMGATAPCHAHLDRALSLAESTELKATITNFAAAALGLLELGATNYQQAAAELARTAALVAEYGPRDPCVIQWRPDFVESLARTGRRAEAREQLAVLDAEAAATGSRWAEATAARCRGLLQDTPQRAIAQLEEAVTLAETSVNMFEQARAHLCLGEALRHARRRGDARPQLQQAHTAFEFLGAQSWADRAAAELAATGITATPRRTPVHARLTPQELRVALQVSEGLTNQEVATQLFLSSKTIEVHLSHIYSKLGVHSRTSLARLIHSGVVQTDPATDEADAPTAHH
jgi:DNA-binding CsgD family transcriptional regulator/integrase